ncbi:hypothetical protein MKX03_032705 [Papaver bracteatum]|nr:hypothetical protein MKX03_032705 [Papaver bracteatum]
MERANIISWVMLVVVVMALYVGTAEAWPCAYDCAKEHAEQHGGSRWGYVPECMELCLHHSWFPNLQSDFSPC